MSKLPHARISLTLPPEVLVEADRVADELDRSRSWVISEAIRRYANAGGGGDNPAPTPGRAAPGESARLISQGRTSLDDQRVVQLLVEMAMTPEERVLASERAAVAVADAGPRPEPRVLAFRRFEAYLALDQDQRPW